MPKRVLVVDDSSSVRAQMRTFLEEEGYEVIEGKDGKIGLERVLSESPDLILCDVNMPVMNGLDMLKELRDRGIQTPTFMLTTEASRAMVQRGREVGALAWMTKPFKPSALLKGLRKVLGE